MRRLPGGWTSPRRTGREPVPAYTAPRSTRSSPGASQPGALAAPRGTPGSSVTPAGPAASRPPGWPDADRVTGHSFIRPPSNSVHAPGSGVHALIWRSIRCAGSFQFTRASAGVSLGARLRYRPQRPVLDPVQRGDQQLGADGGQPLKQAARGVGGPHRLGHHAEHRAGVQFLDDPEGGGAGDVVPVQNRVVHGRGAAPGGQHREMQVHPAMPRDVKSLLREQRPVGGHRAAVRRDFAQPVEKHEIVRANWFENFQTRLAAQRRNRGRLDPPAASGRRVRPGNDRLDRMPRGEDRAQRGSRDLRGAGEDQAHRSPAPSGDPLR